MTITPKITAGTITEKEEKTSTDLAGTWNVLVFDDPVNLMAYVAKVFQKVFGYPRERAEEPSEGLVLLGLEFFFRKEALRSR